MTAEQRDALILADDATLMRQVNIAFSRSGGPGGQHRNKVESGVRVTHAASGVTAAATERRSQHENRRVALERLRAALALEIRGPAATAETLPLEVREVLQSKRWPRLSPNSHDFYRVAARILDALAEDKARVSDTAARLGVSTGSVIKFLGCEAHLWQAAQKLRQAAGQASLKK